MTINYRRTGLLSGRVFCPP